MQKQNKEKKMIELIILNENSMFNQRKYGGVFLHPYGIFSWGVPDIILISKKGFMTEVEIKNSIEDFRKELEKKKNKIPEFRNEFKKQIRQSYYAAPFEIAIEISKESNNNHGIIGLRDRNVELIKKPKANTSAKKIDFKMVSKLLKYSTRKNIRSYFNEHN